MIVIARWAEASGGWPSRACRHLDFASPGRRSGMILRGDVISPVRQATLPRRGFIGDGAQVFLPPDGKPTAGQLPAQHARAIDNLLCPSAPAQAHRDSPWGSQSGAKGDGRARMKDIPARIRGVGGTQRAGNMPKRVRTAR